MNRMKQNFLSLLSDVPDGSLGPSILKMGVYATVSDQLLVGSAMLDEGVVCEAAVVSLILLNFDSVASGKLFEGLLGLNRFVRGERLLQMDVAET